MAPRNQEKLAKKTNYINKLKTLLDTVSNILIVSCDNVGSKQFQEIRCNLRGRATVVMGKNTMIRFAIRQYADENPEKDLGPLLNIVNGNIGLIFCNEDMPGIRKEVESNQVPAAAKAGTIATVDVIIPQGPTGMDPSQTNFFQALNIATKIVKGSVEIIQEVHLVKIGQKVNMSEQVFLQKLNIKPFSFGLIATSIVQDFAVFDAKVLDITDDMIVQKFSAGLSNLAAISRVIGFPTEASIPHGVVTAFKNIAALCSDMDFTFAEIDDVKEYLKDPSKFAAAAPAAAGATEAAAPQAAAVVEEEEEEEEMDFDLFD